jgi:hypothetical protein
MGIEQGTKREQGTKEGEGNGTEKGKFFAPIKKQSFERDLGTFVSIT